MRRFEFSDGKSNKFWQIDRLGQSVRVEFGRIGTNGQNQEKDHGSEASAKTEYDKLVREKLKKGYKEVGDSPVGAGNAVAAEPAAAVVGDKNASPPATKSKAVEPHPLAPESSAPTQTITLHAEERIEWTSTALGRLAAVRGSALGRHPAPDAKALYGRLKRDVAAMQSFTDSGIQRKNAAKAKMTLAREAFAEAAPPAHLDSATQAAAYALYAPPNSYSDEGRGDEFVLFWATVVGPLFALETLLIALDLPSESSDTFIALVEGEATEVRWWRSRYFAWRGLRQIVATAREEDYAKLRDYAETHRAQTNRRGRALLAAAFECPSWFDVDLTNGTVPKNDYWDWFWPLLVSAASVEEVRTLQAHSPSAWSLVHALVELRYDILGRYQLAALPLFFEVFDDTKHLSTEHARDFASCLAQVVSPKVADFFAKQLPNGTIRAISANYLQSRPELSLPTLAHIASSKGAVADLASGILKSIVAAQPALATGFLPSLSPAARHKVEELLEQNQPKEEAVAEELCPVLRLPPWTKPRHAVAPVVLELDVLALPESMAWKPGECEAILSASALKELEAEPTWFTQWRANEGRQQRRWAGTLAQLPRASFLRLLPELDPDQFEWSYGNILETLVARHGLAVLELVLRVLPRDPVSGIEATSAVNSTRLALLMADGFVRLKKARPAAVAWLLRFPETATIGLVPAALGKPGKTRAAAEAALRLMANRGQRDLVASVAARYGSQATEGLAQILDYDPLDAYPTKLPKIPAFFTPASLTRPLLAGGKKALPLAAVQAFGMQLAFSTLEDPYPGIAQVKLSCDPRSLAEFAWDLFQAWTVAGMPSKEQWAMLALAHLGNDETARRLTPLIRAWPGEGGHARAVLGLDVLAHIGTDVALMHLHGIAQKLKFKGLQEKAREKIVAVAEARDLTADELADRLVPDLGLDEDGSLELSFGARTFRVAFDESLKPAVLDDTGKRLPDLPKPRQTDDAEKAQLATDTWKALKKDSKTIASGQILRLELAMCAERRWSPEVFRSFFVEHPLLIHLVRRLVWGLYDEQNVLVSSFRVAEDSSFASATDDAFDLPEGARIGIVHRLHLNEALAKQWGQTVADYEILQPFAQLSREVTLMTEAEAQATVLTRVQNLKLPTGKILGLDSRGWRRGPPQDGGVVCWYEKPLANGMVVNLDLDPGIYTGAISESPEQTLGELHLTQGQYGWSRERQLAFGQLAPIAYSELVRDLEGLRS